MPSSFNKDDDWMEHPPEDPPVGGAADFFKFADSLMGLPNANSPWKFDPFKIERPVPGQNKLKGRRPRAQIPEADLLFDVQRDILKALRILKQEKYDGAALRDIKNGYRVINRYLRRYARGDHGEHNFNDISGL